MSDTASPKHLLIITPPGGKPLQFELKGSRIGLGRSTDNHICIEFGQVSGSHLEFEREGNGYVVKDLKSTNGVTINGDRVTDPIEMRDGDRLMIGRTIPAHYLVVAAGEKATAAAAFGDEKDQERAAAFASMDEKIQKLEVEAHDLEDQVAKLKSEYESTQKEHDRALEEMKSAESKLREKESSGAGEAELDALQSDLLEQTRRFKVLASDLDGQKQQLAQLQGGEATPLRPSSPPQPAQPVKPSFAKPAPVGTLQATPQPAQASNPLAPSQPAEAAQLKPSPPQPKPASAPLNPSPRPAAPATSQPAAPPSAATPQLSAAPPAKPLLQTPDDPNQPAKPTMKLQPSAEATKRPGLNVPKRPPGNGPKTVKLG